MKLDREKINIEMARKKMTIGLLAEKYGVSNSRMNTILNQREVTTVCAGRLADALSVDVMKIVAD